jgi:excisionase family DNA binding protein
VASAETKSGVAGQEFLADLAEGLAILRSLDIQRKAAAAEEQGWLNTEHAAAYMDMSLEALKAMVKRGEITPYKFANKRRRFKPADLDALLTPTATTAA